MTSKRTTALSLTLALAMAGCGTPCYVTTEPRAAEVFVDGKFAGIGGATFETNGVVFNTYKVEARDRQGRVLDSRDVDVHFGPRSAVFAGVGLVGIIFWPLLPLLPAAFFVGEPSPEHVHLHVPNVEPEPTPEPERIDRPVLEIAAPANGDEVPVDVDATGRHVISVVAKSLRGADASEELRVTRIVPGTPPPPPPEKVPGLEIK